MSSADERRQARANWPIRRYRLGDEPLVDPLDATTVAERISLVAALSSEMWHATGLVAPVYQRDSMPGQIIRGR